MRCSKPSRATCRFSTVAAVPTRRLWATPGSLSTTRRTRRAGSDAVRMLIRLARRGGAKIVWTQNGVACPGWHGPGWERTNAPLAHGLHGADRIFFQSEFCKVSSDRFLGEHAAPWEVLHNSV